MQQDGHQDKFVTELLEFFSMKEEDAHPLSFWSRSKSRWSLLSSYAALWFSIQPTEIESEREFSSSGKVIPLLYPLVVVFTG